MVTLDKVVGRLKSIKKSGWKIWHTSLRCHGTSLFTFSWKKKLYVLKIIRGKEYKYTMLLKSKALF